MEMVRLIRFTIHLNHSNLLSVQWISNLLSLKLNAFYLKLYSLLWEKKW